MKLQAYAKVNLILNILGKRPDGYHEIETLMHAVSLSDDVELELFPEGSLERPVMITMNAGDEGFAEAGKPGISEAEKPSIYTAGKPEFQAVPEEDNLACKAVRIMRRELGFTEDVSIRIAKRIPMAGGLGGGSADAAAVMTGLAVMLDLDKPERLLSLGAELGSDVPFCIAAQNGCPAAIATGRGTELRFIKPLDLAMDLDFSGRTIENKTRAVYGELRPEDYRTPYSIDSFLKAETTEDRRSLMGNHLQAPAERLMGLRIPKGSMLCGAGPTVLTLSDTGSVKTIL